MAKKQPAPENAQRPKAKRAPSKKRRKSKKSGTGPIVQEMLNVSFGRPPKLVADERTCNIIHALSSLHCTIEDAAARLRVHRQTLSDFLAKNPEALEAWELGVYAGKAALRKMQFDRANKGCPQMQKWLGANWLNQSMKISHTGPAGGPIRTINQNVGANMSEQELADLWQRELAGG